MSCLWRHATPADSGVSKATPLPLLLHIIQSHALRCPQEQRAGASVEHLVDGGHLHFLGDFVLQVLDDDGVRAVEHREAVARHPDRGEARRALAFGCWKTKAIENLHFGASFGAGIQRKRHFWSENRITIGSKHSKPKKLEQSSAQTTLSAGCQATRQIGRGKTRTGNHVAAIGWTNPLSKSKPFPSIYSTAKLRQGEDEYDLRSMTANFEHFLELFRLVIRTYFIARRWTPIPQARTVIAQW